MNKKTKIMIFGGCGFVGGNIAEIAAKKGYEPILADTENKSKLKKFKFIKCDITNKLSVNKAVLKERPAAVINVAAIANIDFAQNNRELTYNVNTEGAKNIAEACVLSGSSYVFFSSDAVYKGDALSYLETDTPDPVNYYGITKLEAEKKISEVMPEAKVIRISLVLGFPVDGGNSFFLSLKNKLEAGGLILCPEKEIRTPIDVTTLAEAVLELGLNDYSGVLHIGAKSSISRLELTKKAAELMGYGTDSITLMDEEDVQKRTPRHNNGVLDVTKAENVLNTKMPELDEAIKRAYATISNME